MSKLNDQHPQNNPQPANNENPIKYYPNKKKEKESHVSSEFLAPR
jgi:hypothetical protein